MAETNPSPNEQVDQLVLIIVSDEQAGTLCGELIKHGFRLTLVNIKGGFIQAGSTFLLVGIHSPRHQDLLDVIGSVCHTHNEFIPTGGPFGAPGGLPPLIIEAEVGSAYVYTMDVERYEQF